ncbi:hypothetical protein BDV98DRAFT_656401 [Pterulicium gracile]|uniref:Uncharacterized protein n=1 Tax=Pterulicium gracile TaxID=1884261 RepID=A0A5C3QGC3_9AGAR|nr:hypothetical protein BDV98DRAFT_656401 [Pterula gracilis]
MATQMIQLDQLDQLDYLLSILNNCTPSDTPPSSPPPFVYLHNPNLVTIPATFVPQQQMAPRPATAKTRKVSSCRSKKDVVLGSTTAVVPKMKKLGRTREEKKIPNESYPCVKTCGQSFPANDVHLVHMKSCKAAKAFARSHGLEPLEELRDDGTVYKRLTPVERLTRVCVVCVVDEAKAAGINFSNQPEAFVHWDPQHCNTLGKRYRFKRVYVAGKQLSAASPPPSPSTSSFTSSMATPSSSSSTGFTVPPPVFPMGLSFDLNSPPSAMWSLTNSAASSPSSSGIATPPNFSTTLPAGSWPAPNTLAVMDDYEEM